MKNTTWFNLSLCYFILCAFPIMLIIFRTGVLELGGWVIYIGFYPSFIFLNLFFNKIIRKINENLSDTLKFKLKKVSIIVIQNYLSLISIFFIYLLNILLENGFLVNPVQRSIISFIGGLIFIMYFITMFNVIKYISMGISILFLGRKKWLLVFLSIIFMPIGYWYLVYMYKKAEL